MRRFLSGGAAALAMLAVFSMLAALAMLAAGCAEEKPAPQQRQEPRRTQPMRSEPTVQHIVSVPRAEMIGPSGNQEFEDRLKKFLQDSDSRIADNRLYAEHRSRSRRR